MSYLRNQIAFLFSTYLKLYNSLKKSCNTKPACMLDICNVEKKLKNQLIN